MHCLKGCIVSSVRPRETGRGPASLHCNCYDTNKPVFLIDSIIPIKEPGTLSPSKQAKHDCSAPYTLSLIAIWWPKVWNEGTYCPEGHRLWFMQFHITTDICVKQGNMEIYWVLLCDLEEELQINKLSKSSTLWTYFYAKWCTWCMLVFCQTAKYFLLKEMFIGFLKLSNEGCYEVCVFISSVIHILSSHLLMTYCQTNRRQSCLWSSLSSGDKDMQSDSHYKRREVPGNKGQRGEMNNHGGEFAIFFQEGTFCCISWLMHRSVTELGAQMGWE